MLLVDLSIFLVCHFVQTLDFGSTPKIIFYIFYKKYQANSVNTNVTHRYLQKRCLGDKIILCFASTDGILSVDAVVQLFFLDEFLSPAIFHYLPSVSLWNRPRWLWKTTPKPTLYQLVPIWALVWCINNFCGRSYYSRFPVRNSRRPGSW